MSGPRVDYSKNTSNDIVIATTSVLTFKLSQISSWQSELCHLVEQTKSYLFNAIYRPFLNSLVPIFQSESSWIFVQKEFDMNPQVKSFSYKWFHTKTRNSEMAYLDLGCRICLTTKPKGRQRITEITCVTVSSVVSLKSIGNSIDHNNINKQTRKESCLNSFNFAQGQFLVHCFSSRRYQENTSFAISIYLYNSG